MKNFSLIFGSVLLSLTQVVACGPKEDPSQTQKLPTTCKILAFSCEGNRSFAVHFDPEGKSVQLNMDDTSIELPHVTSGSGAKYRDGRTTLWMKGEGAFVEMNGKIILRDCRVKK